MILGSHVILFSTDADADREFLDRAFGLHHVDAGGGDLGLQRRRHPTMIEGR